jgi:hypothetical protein
MSCSCGGQLPAAAAQMSGGGKRGGYRATRKNRNLLKKYKAGKTLGFTQTASLKAKGLLPRTSKKNRGKYIVSKKYQ